MIKVFIQLIPTTIRFDEIKYFTLGFVIFSVCCIFLLYLAIWRVPVQECTLYTECVSDLFCYNTYIDELRKVRYLNFFIVCMVYQWQTFVPLSADFLMTGIWLPNLCYKL